MRSGMAGLATMYPKRTPWRQKVLPRLPRTTTLCRMAASSATEHTGPASTKAMKGLDDDDDEVVEHADDTVAEDVPAVGVVGLADGSDRLPRSWMKRT